MYESSKEKNFLLLNMSTRFRSDKFGVIDNIGLSVPSLQGTDFTTHKGHPYMLAHTHNKGLLLRLALADQYK